MRFLSYVLATILGLILFFALAFFLLMGIGSAFSPDAEIKVKDNSILTIPISGTLVEREFDDPFEQFNNLAFMEETTIGLINLKDAIKKAAEDDKIRGIYLKMGILQAGYSSLNELREELQAFQETGKFVVAYGEIFSEKSYYLASVADHLYMTETAGIEFNGLVIELTYIKNTLDKLGVEPLIFKVGDFKSAVEPFIRESISEENKLQLTQLLDTIYNNNLSDISTSRKVPVDRLKQVANNLELGYSNQGLDLGMIDGVMYEDEVLNSIKKIMGVGLEDELNTVEYGKYKKVINDLNTSSNRIAVVIATGDIVTGKGDNLSIGSDRFVKVLRELREDDKVDGIVLRVNSPGGSIIASDVIWHEIKEIRKVKPVVASMSDVAASGGYYISMACDTIVAMPNTITGSIGIFGVLFNAGPFLEDKLGVTTSRVTTAPHADIFTLTHPLDEVQENFIQRNVEKGYQTFISKAAEGRNMSEEAIREVASGRVWSGEKAKELGLVDVLGGIDEAISIVAERAELEDYKIRFYPKPKTFVEQFLQDFEAKAKEKAIKDELGEYYKLYHKLANLSRYEGFQARMPYEITIK